MSTDLVKALQLWQHHKLSSNQYVGTYVVAYTGAVYVAVAAMGAAYVLVAAMGAAYVGACNDTACAMKEVSTGAAYAGAEAYTGGATIVVGAGAAYTGAA